MVDAHHDSKIVSIEAFRATRPAGGGLRSSYRAPKCAQPQPSARSIEHRERMLRFLREAAVEARASQGRLLL